jgi:uncharacterized membrane protein
MENTQKQENTQKEDTTPAINEANKNEKIMSAICYIPVLFLIPFFLVKDKSKTLNFHINQGIILSILFILGYFIMSLLPFITKSAVDIWKLIILIFTIIGIVNVCNNKEKKLPLIGNILNII